MSKRQTTNLPEPKSKKNKTQTPPKTYYVTANTLSVRLAPNRDAQKTNTLHKREKVEVFEEVNGWSRISDYYSGEIEGVSGEVARWVSSAYLSLERPQNSKPKIASSSSR